MNYFEKVNAARQANVIPMDSLLNNSKKNEKISSVQNKQLSRNQSKSIGDLLDNNSINQQNSKFSKNTKLSKPLTKNDLEQSVNTARKANTIHDEQLYQRRSIDQPKSSFSKSKLQKNSYEQMVNKSRKANSIFDDQDYKSIGTNKKNTKSVKGGFDMKDAVQKARNANKILQDDFVSISGKSKKQEKQSMKKNESIFKSVTSGIGGITTGLLNILPGISILKGGSNGIQFDQKDVQFVESNQKQKQQSRDYLDELLQQQKQINEKQKIIEAQKKQQAKKEKLKKQFFEQQIREKQKIQMQAIALQQENKRKAMQVIMEKKKLQQIQQQREMEQMKYQQQLQIQANKRIDAQKKKLEEQTFKMQQKQRKDEQEKLKKKRQMQQAAKKQKQKKQQLKRDKQIQQREAEQKKKALIEQAEYKRMEDLWDQQQQNIKEQLQQQNRREQQQKKLRQQQQLDNRRQKQQKNRRQQEQKKKQQQQLKKKRQQQQKDKLQYEQNKKKQQKNRRQVEQKNRKQAQQKKRRQVEQKNRQQEQQKNKRKQQQKKMLSMEWMNQQKGNRNELQGQMQFQIAKLNGIQEQLQDLLMNNGDQRRINKLEQQRQKIISDIRDKIFQQVEKTKDITKPKQKKRQRNPVQQPSMKDAMGTNQSNDTKRIYRDTSFKANETKDWSNGFFSNQPNIKYQQEFKKEFIDYRNKKQTFLRYNDNQYNFYKPKMNTNDYLTNEQVQNGMKLQSLLQSEAVRKGDVDEYRSKFQTLPKKRLRQNSQPQKGLVNKRVKVAENFVKQQLRKENQATKNDILRQIESELFNQQNIDKLMSELKSQILYFPPNNVYDAIKQQFPQSSVDDVIFSSVAFGKGYLSQINKNKKQIQYIYQNVKPWGQYLFDIGKLEKLADKKQGSSNDRTYILRIWGLQITLKNNKTINVLLNKRQISPDRFYDDFLYRQVSQDLKSQGKTIYRKFLKSKM